MRRLISTAALLLASCAHGTSRPQPETIASCRGLDQADVPEAAEQFDKRDHIAFLPDSWLLLGDNHDVLAKRAEWYKGQPGHGLLVRGLTGRQAGADELSLARQRVERVAVFLIRQGVTGTSVRRETAVLTGGRAVKHGRAQPYEIGVIVQVRSC